ncbi:NAD(P)H-dependent oxidoreductase [Adhaeribacter swui]|uniref:NAD(P)H-dependent oxidoreductase n=1 Tax=Adhaeribacter swui TaxID=2086471 RepID=A0A7G7GEU9_9BACT|nr:NAD(P)H-dependent oxidoreductase [Adhaeribacter swui]QNF35683.1 NAD(P)H-dependent oxidoreductase [Adhaeribacter swui]
MPLDGKNQPHILILNGSIRGVQGNSYALAKLAENFLTTKLSVNASILNLAEPKPSTKEVYDLLLRSAGFLVVSGTYWSSWGSPLQRFLEVATTFENSPAFFGKPVACAVSMDSVGGAEVASRMHAAFAGLGCWSPPCATLAVSRVGQEAITASLGQTDDPNEDVWRIADLEIILKNLITATTLHQNLWVSWPHVTLSMPDGPWPETGTIDLNTPRFI